MNDFLNEVDDFISFLDDFIAFYEGVYTQYQLQLLYRLRKELELVSNSFDS